MIFLFSILKQLPIVVMMTLWWFLCFAKNYNGSKSQLSPIFLRKIISYGTYAYVHVLSQNSNIFSWHGWNFQRYKHFCNVTGFHLSVLICAIETCTATSITYIKVPFPAAACCAVCAWNKLYQCLKRVWNDWLTILKVFLKSSRRSRETRAFIITFCGVVGSLLFCI